MTQRIELQEENGQLTVALTLWGRVVAGTFRALKIFPWLLVIAVVFFLPDFIGQYTVGDPIPAIFWWASIVGLVILLAGLWGVLRVVRRDRWIFDGGDRQVIAEVPRLWRAPVRGEAELRQIEALELTTRRFPFESKLEVRIDTDEEGIRRESIISEPGMAEQLEKTGEAIIEFLRRHRYYVDLERPDEQEEEPSDG